MWRSYGRLLSKRTKSVADAINLGASVVTIGALVWEIAKYSFNLFKTKTSKTQARADILTYFESQTLLPKRSFEIVVDRVIVAYWEQP